RRALHLLLRGAEGRQARPRRRVDPRGTEPADRDGPRFVRGPEPLPPVEPMPRVPLEPLRASLHGDGQGPRVRGRYGSPMDAPCMPTGPPPAPRADRALLDGQDLAGHVRRERPRRDLPDAP